MAWRGALRTVLTITACSGVSRPSTAEVLDEAQQPLFAAPGVIIAVTYAAQHLDSDVVAAFGDRNVIILK
jgi:hypothetical protein